MLYHYIKIAFRNLLKYKLQSFICIVGLAIGFTSFALSSLWIRYELTYDTFRKDADRIYYVRMESETDDPKDYQALHLTAGPIFERDIPGDRGKLQHECLENRFPLQREEIRIFRHGHGFSCRTYVRNRTDLR